MRLLSVGSNDRRGRRRPTRKRPAPPWLRPTIQVAAATAVLAVLTGGVMQLQASGWLGERVTALRLGAVAASAELGLKVADVAVSGRERTTRDELLAALDVRRGDPIIGFDPQAARERLEGLPWVRSARVERSLPDVVRVDIVERQPLALWQVDRRLQIIDHQGQVIRVADKRPFRNLPVIVGPDAATHAPVLLQLLGGEPDLAKRMTAAIRVAERRWNIRLDDRVEIRLPAQDIGVAWSRLAAMERTNAVLGRDIVAVDLRLPDRTIVQLAPGAKLRTAGPGKST